MLSNEPALAVVMAIDTKEGVIANHFREKSFNGEQFFDFMKDLRSAVGEERFLVVLDNCTIHKTHKVRNYCE